MVAYLIGMYLRTTKRRNGDGSEVRYYQLAENTWDAERGCAVAKIIYNFGRADQVDGEKLRRLAKSILRVFGGEEAAAGAAGGDVRMRFSWPYGGVYVVGALWKELGIDTVLRSHGGPKAEAFERALFVMVANRCLSPYSKLYCWEQWLREEVFLPSGQDLALHHLYLAMDFLQKHKAEVEKAIYFQMADLLNADVDLIFYDTTSLHFEVDEEDETERKKAGRTYPALRKRGHSKNGRTDAPQIVIGLAVTRDGLPGALVGLLGRDERRDDGREGQRGPARMATRPLCLRRRRWYELGREPPEAGARQRQVHPCLPHARRRRGDDGRRRTSRAATSPCARTSASRRCSSEMASGGAATSSVTTPPKRSGSVSTARR